MSITDMYKSLEENYNAGTAKNMASPFVHPFTVARLAEIIKIAEGIQRYQPNQFADRASAMFYTVAQAIMASFAAGEMISLSSANGCIHLYQTAANHKVLPPAEIHFCKQDGEPCRYCVEQFRRCKYFYEVA